MRLPLSLSGQDRQNSDRHPFHLAEVVETSTTEFLAQCLDPKDLAFPTMPPFGSWVKSKDEESGSVIYGIVYQVSTRPVDSVHRTRALGLSLAELREEQPQIFAMLKTEFQAAIVGFSTGDTNTVRQYLPPRPPQVHQAVYGCSAPEVLAFTDRLDFLPTLLQLNAAPIDSLIGAILREGYQLRKADRAWLVQSGRTLGAFLKEDYDRLRLILSQIHI